VCQTVQQMWLELGLLSFAADSASEFTHHRTSKTAHANSCMHVVTRTFAQDLYT